MSDRVERIRACLAENLNPTHLELIDQSAAHAGHSGAIESGGGHFFAVVVSTAFEGKTPVQRHQTVYRALGELMHSDIHALSMQLFTPSEFQSKGNP